VPDRSSASEIPFLPTQRGLRLGRLSHHSQEERRGPHLVQHVITWIRRGGNGVVELRAFWLGRRPAWLVSECSHPSGRESGQRYLIVGYEAEVQGVGQQVSGQGFLASIGPNPPKFTPERAHPQGEILPLGGSLVVMQVA
jgi:hypothetical protein